MDAPDLRLFFVGPDQVPQPEEPAVTKGWAAATHASMNEAFVHPKLGPYEYSEVTYYFGKALHKPLQGTQMRFRERRLVDTGFIRADCTQRVKIGENTLAVDTREMVNHRM